MSSDPTELLDAFRAAALSVTKLYKTSASAQAKSRADGYHECLEDILAFLDREGIGASEGEAGRIRKWATERLEGRDSLLESEDEVEKAEVASPPHTQRSSSAPQPSVPQIEVQMKDVVPPAAPTTQPPAVQIPIEETEIVVPTQDTFNFQSSLAYPHDAYMNLANLDLSDSQAHTMPNRPPASSTTPRNIRGRNARVASRAANLGRGAGQKRKVNLAEIFDLSSLGHGSGKDVFGGGKRSRFA
ncbi:hypothetical protein B0T25DRAFT_243203 [Lasiosphaeria hispida]|uniref:Uncharacterized protein n=1 Tax=Lasiosphaeria hispida TaxID=260671 RepID=A0AAJ0HEL1_9PEZI|nr:hypothetical protein B0T25DRAFT_243203 [Lasiosphaeria hispida]